MDERLAFALLSLEGLSVGDAFGEQFFVPSEQLDQLLNHRVLPPPPWPFTDDTNMALSVIDVLRRHGQIDADELAHSFAHRYDHTRGYGPGMHRLLRQLAAGEPWQLAARAQFDGQGSFGNGAAMRSAPIGAYYADNLSAVVEQTERAARVTHAHPEGIAGAIAVAVATALAWQMKRAGHTPSAAEFLEAVAQNLPPSEVASKIRRAGALGAEATQAFAVSVLGNGANLSAQDTVPYSLWCAARALSDYTEALWLAVRGLGDRDTTCAIVGGIVVQYSGQEGIPPDWWHSREALPGWHAA